MTIGSRRSSEARSEDAVKAEVINDIIPVPGTVDTGTVGRTLPHTLSG